MEVDVKLKTIYQDIQSVTSSKFDTHASTISSALETMQRNISDVTTSLKMPDTWDDDVSIEISGSTTTTLTALIDACKQPLTNVIQPTGGLVESLKILIKNHIKAVENYNSTQISLTNLESSKPDLSSYKTGHTEDNKPKYDHSRYQTDLRYWNARCTELQRSLEAYEKEAGTNQQEAYQKISTLRSMLVPGGSYFAAVSSTHSGATVTKIEETTPEGYRKVGIKVVSADNVLLEETYEIYNGDQLIESWNVSYNEDKTITQQYIQYIPEGEKIGTIHCTAGGVPINEVYEIDLGNGTVKYANRSYSEDGTSLETYSVRNANNELIEEGLNKYSQTDSSIDLKGEIAATVEAEQAQAAAVEYYKKTYNMSDALAEQTVADDLRGNNIPIEATPQPAAGSSATVEPTPATGMAQVQEQSDGRTFTSQEEAVEYYKKTYNMSDALAEQTVADDLRGNNIAIEATPQPVAGSSATVEPTPATGMTQVQEQSDGRTFTSQEEAVEYYKKTYNMSDALAEQTVADDLRGNNITIEATPTTGMAQVQEQSDGRTFTSQEEAVEYYKKTYNMSDALAEQTVRDDLMGSNITIEATPQPVEGTQLPVEGTQLPVEGTQLPVEGTGAAVEQAQYSNNPATIEVEGFENVGTTGNRTLYKAEGPQVVYEYLKEGVEYGGGPITQEAISARANELYRTLVTTGKVELNGTLYELMPHNLGGKDAYFLTGTPIESPDPIPQPAVDASPIPTPEPVVQPNPTPIPNIEKPNITGGVNLDAQPVMMKK